jgi:uncharacterized membrane protein
MAPKFEWSRLHWRKLGGGVDWRRLTRTFFAGLIAVLPIMVTLAVVMWLIGAADSFFGGVVRIFLPNARYLPGMGLLVSLIIIFVIGMLMQAVFFREFVAWLEDQLERVPLIKTVYGAVRDLTGFLSKKDGRRFDKVVLVQVPNVPIRLLGFVTVEDLASIGLAQGDDSVAVYLPMSYQIGGYTVLLPASYLQPLDMSMEEAMRFLITAGLSRSEEPPAR